MIAVSTMNVVSGEVLTCAMKSIVEELRVVDTLQRYIYIIPPRIPVAHSLGQFDRDLQSILIK